MFATVPIPLIDFKIYISGAREMAQCFRTYTAFAENLSLVPHTHIKHTLHL